jgi:EAL domain-containing protein (putative c-di-GMP-specific phosphodiesterase class I)
LRPTNRRSYLRSFPFDNIKIDRSFAKDLVERTDCVAIVRAISGLGRSLNITTTAEGVETTDQHDWLRAEGCNQVQGFLFSAAKPASRNCWLALVRGSRRRRKSSRVQTRPGLPAFRTAQLLLIG